MRGIFYVLAPTQSLTVTLNVGWEGTLWEGCCRRRPWSRARHAALRVCTTCACKARHRAVTARHPAAVHSVCTLLLAPPGRRWCWTTAALASAAAASRMKPCCSVCAVLHI